MKKGPSGPFFAPSFRLNSKGKTIRYEKIRRSLMMLIYEVLWIGFGILLIGFGIYRWINKKRRV
jgi:hypothetical protein